MANIYGVEIFGIDLSINMINIANELRESQPPGVKHRVQFHVEDATTMDYPQVFYDTVYSRDTILHIEDKKSLFAKFYDCLKPGGRIVITDYCHGDKPEHRYIFGHTNDRVYFSFIKVLSSFSAHFKDYVKSRGYHLLTVQGYGQVLESVGFVQLQAIDMTKEFINILEGELKEFIPKKDAIQKEFSQKDFDYIVSGWTDKIERCSSGDQAWGYFVAKKPFA
jgi:phosphoethanolamine N-methyltransferase